MWLFSLGSRKMNEHLYLHTILQNSPIFWKALREKWECASETWRYYNVSGKDQAWEGNNDQIKLNRHNPLREKKCFTKVLCTLSNVLTIHRFFAIIEGADCNLNRLKMSDYWLSPQSLCFFFKNLSLSNQTQLNAYANMF